MSFMLNFVIILGLLFISLAIIGGILAVIKGIKTDILDKGGKE